MTTKYAIVNAVIYFVLAGITAGMWWLLLVMATVLLQEEARGDDMIPFTMDGPYYSLMVTMQGPRATLTQKCSLDTAAQGFWVSFEKAEQLGYSMKIARDSGYTMPGFTLTRLQVGTKVHSGYSARAWNKLAKETCLVGSDVFFGNFTTFDFRNMVIAVQTNPSDYWWQHWNACSETLRLTQNNYNACYQTARYAWERCIGPFPW